MSADLVALRFLSPGVASLVPVEEPALEPGEALVAPRFIGICGTDLDLLAGTMAYITIGETHFPIQPGHEWSGIVVSSSRPDLPPGTPVIGDPIVGCGTCEVCAAGPDTHCVTRREQGVRGSLAGAAASLIAFPERNLHRIPDGLPLAHAALAEPSVTAMEGIGRLGGLVRPGAGILVIGAGTLGLIATQLLLAAGCSVTVAARSETGLARVEALGATPLRLERDTAGPSRAFDGVIEASGGANSPALGIEALRAGGTMAVLGVPPGPVAGFDLMTMIVRDLTMSGVLNGPGRYDEALAAIAAGRIRAEAIIDRIVPLADAAHAFELMADCGRPRPKLLLTTTA